jgi:hypothetical protein
MPRLNGSGPDGKGPETGRGLGNCSQKSLKDFSRLGIGRGKRRRAENISGEKRQLKNGFRFFKF